MVEKAAWFKDRLIELCRRPEPKGVGAACKLLVRGRHQESGARGSSAELGDDHRSVPSVGRYLRRFHAGAYWRAQATARPAAQGRGTHGRARRSATAVTGQAEEEGTEGEGVTIRPNCKLRIASSRPRRRDGGWSPRSFAILSIRRQAEIGLFRDGGTTPLEVHRYIQDLRREVEEEVIHRCLKRAS